jgi:molybdate transport system substrate-binding protein
MTAAVRRRWPCVLAGCLLAAGAGAAEITVSAASSLSNAFREIASAYEQQQGGDKVLLNFAASDALVQQIGKGAPVDVFAAADQEAMDKAASLKLLQPGSRRNFASNSVVLIAPLAAAVTLTRLADLRQPGVGRVAIGNPASVPIGRYARQALEQARLWPVVEAKAIWTSSVRQSLDYVARGEVDAGFVYATDVAAQKDRVRVVATVPTTTPVLYPLAIVATAPQGDGARRFAAFVLAPQGQAILARHGFGRP